MAADEKSRAFMKALLNELHVLERMLGTDVFERGCRRVGAEQEMFLVGRDMQPAPLALEVLRAADEPRLTTELARFNLEANATARRFDGPCLRDMHAELDELVDSARRAAAGCGAEVLLAGIMPTLRKHDLTLANMTPADRYRALNAETVRLRGGEFRVAIKGVDELQATHDNVMMEACNTSFQLHFQVDPEEFAKLYNVAQLVTAPVLAAAVNSPMFLGRRLWSETRIALFHSSVDSRSDALQERGQPPRVSFGEEWVRESVLEIFREQIARYRVVLPLDAHEDPAAVLDAGGAPRLQALCAHNGTIYRWNRACYGVSDGRAHLRIENRALPAGPTTTDEIANAALFFGLLAAYARRYGNVATIMDFAEAKNNFFAAAREGLRAQFVWLDGKTYAAADLLLERLLPTAREGLRAADIDGADIDRYLGVLERRVASSRTGARWVVESLTEMGTGATRDLRERSLVAAMIDNQKRGDPVAAWPLATVDATGDWRHGFRTVGQFMSTDLYTVRRDDLVDLAASLMDWQRIQHILVEDDDGRLVGIVTHRSLLRLIARGLSSDGDRSVVVEDIMREDPATVTPDTPTLDAMYFMRDNKLGCLPVVQDGKLVGIITQTDLIDVSARLLEEYLRA